MVDSTPNKPEPTSVQQFFSRLGKDYKDKADQQEIGNLLSQYQQNRQDGNALEDLWIGLEKSTVGPTKRLEAQAKIKDFAGIVKQKDEALNKQALKMEQENNKKLAAKEKEDARKAKEKAELDKTAKTQEEVKEILLHSGEKPEEAERLSKVYSVQSANARGKALDKEAENTKSQKVLQSTFDRIIELVPKSGVTLNAKSYLGGESAKTAGELKALGASLESEMKDRVSKGTLSNDRFAYLLSILPQPGESQNTMIGKLKGIAKDLELDTTQLNALEGGKKPEKKEEKKAPEGKVRVKLKGTETFGSVTPYEGMEAKYDIIK